MGNFLGGLPEIINRLFDVLELIVVRLTLLGLVAVGAYALIRTHQSSGKSSLDRQPTDQRPRRAWRPPARMPRLRE